MDKSESSHHTDKMYTNKKVCTMPDARAILNLTNAKLEFLIKFFDAHAYFEFMSNGFDDIYCRQLGK